MIGVSAVIVTMLFIVPALSSYFTEDCQTTLERIKKQKCKIKVEKSIEQPRSLKLTGTDPETFKPCECYEDRGWWSSYRNEIEPGDYFIKNEGQSYFEIIKEDTIIKHEYKCSSE